jgi:hypothetical protein
VKLDTLGGRRFLLTVAAQVSCNVLVWWGKISDDVYSVVVLATVASYITGNVMQRKIESKSEDGA